MSGHPKKLYKIHHLGLSSMERNEATLKSLQGNVAIVCGPIIKVNSALRIIMVLGPRAYNIGV